MRRLLVVPLLFLTVVGYAEVDIYDILHVRKVQCVDNLCEIFHTNGKVEKISKFLLRVKLYEAEVKELKKLQCDEFVCQYPSGRFGGLTPR